MVFETLEPRSLLATLINAGTASDLIFDLPAAASTVILEDDGIAGNGISQLRSTSGTFDATPFANPAGSLTISRGNAADTLTIQALPDFTAGLSIGSPGNPLGSIIFAGKVNLSADKSLTAYASGTISLPNSASQLTTAGSGAISLTTARNIALSSFSRITTVDGNLTLSANQQAVPTTGGFAGIDLARATVQVAGKGNLAFFGRGGGALSTNNHGILLTAGAIVGSTSSALGAGTIALQGTVGEGSQSSAGVALFDSQTSVSSVTGNITITGLPADTAAFTNWGILIGTNASISSTGIATISLIGNGGVGRFNNDGIVVAGAIRSQIGDITLTGHGGTAGGGGSGDDNDGIEILGTIESTGTANITIIGQGGSGSSSNNGVQNEGAVRSASGKITIAGTGGQGTTRNNGILIEGTTGSIHSVDGDISISGIAGGGTLGPFSAVGIGGAGIHSTGSSKISINGSGGLNSYAVVLSGPITSTAPVQITGSAGVAGCGIAAQGGIITSSTGADVKFTADCMLIGIQPINAGNGMVTIRPLTAGYGIDFGGLDTSSSLGITDTELDAITAGTLQIGDAASGPITISELLSLAGRNLTLVTGAGVTGDGAIINGSATAVTVTMDQAGNSTYSGALGGSAADTANNKNLAVTKLGTGTLTLSGSNTYSGTTTVGQGTLTVSGGSAIPDSSDLTVASGALFKLANNERIGGLHGAGTVTDAGSADVAALLVTNSGAFGGSISGRLALNLFGSGKTLTLTGSNTYVGFTQVNGFTLIVDGSISGTAQMTVNNGGTLRGAGAVLPGNDVVEINRGHLGPGSSGPGILTSKTVSFYQCFCGGERSDYDVVLNGTTAGTHYSQLNVVSGFGNGAVYLNGAVNLNVALGFTPAPGDAFTIVKTVGGANNASFIGLLEGKVFTTATGPFSGTFQITYEGNGGTDIVLTALDPANPVIRGTPGHDVFVVKRNVANVDISLDCFVIYSVPIGTLSSLTLDGLAGNDVLTVDSSSGDPFPSGGITFHGGGQSGDTLVTKGVPGGYSTITSTYTSGVPAFAGSIVFVGSQTDTLNYDGVQAAIDISGSTATNLVFQLPPAGSSAFLEDDSTANNNLAQLRSGDNTFATTRFGNVNGTATIRPGHAADVLTVNNLSFREFGASLAIGSAGNEFSAITFAGSLTLAGGKYVSANATGTISLPNSTSKIVSNSGGAPVTLTTARNISLSSGSRISTFGGPITLSANQQATPTSGNFVGVDIHGGEIEASNSVLIIKGRGGDDSSGSQHGVRLRSNTSVSGGHSGLQITGVAGGSGTSSDNVGVFIDSGSGGVASAGPLRVEGVGGAGSGGSNYGVLLDGGFIAAISSGGSVQVTGVEGAGASGTAIVIGSDSDVITSGGGPVTLIGNSMDVDSSATITTGRSGAVQLRPLTNGVGINLGSTSDPIGGPLSLSDAEFGAISGHILQEDPDRINIGNANSGPITISAAIGLAAPMAMNLVSGGSINFTTGSINTSGRNLTLTPGTGSVGMTSAGTDVTVGAGTVSFSSGSDLAIAIHGMVVDTQHEQLKVVGNVNLTGVELAVALNYSPAVGNTFVIVNNDGSDAVIGKFNGLPDGAVFDAANGSFAARLRINYQGGDGNDVVLTAVNTAPTFVLRAETSATDESGPQTIVGFATAISPGLPGEAGQQLLFVVTENTNPGLFAVIPEIDAAGNLTFTPAPNVEGSAQITIVLSDDGGTANGGLDTSPSQTFTIHVTKPHRWHNSIDAFDVTGDGQMAANDALAVINYLNAFGAGSVPPAAMLGPPYFDVSGDDSVAPDDALAVINYLNAFGPTVAGAPGLEGESTSPVAAITAVGDGSDPDWLALLAKDVDSYTKRRRR